MSLFKKSIMVGLLLTSAVARSDELDFCPDDTTKTEKGQDKASFKSLANDFKSALEGDAQQLNKQIQVLARDPVSGFPSFSPDDFSRIPSDAANQFIDIGNGRIRVMVQERVRCTEQFVKRTLFEGTKAELAEYLNKGEAYFNDKGYSLRQVKDQATTQIAPHAIPTDLNKLRTQILNEIQLNAKDLLGKVLPPKLGADCPRLDSTQLPEALKKKTVTLPDATTLSYEDFVDRVQDTQNVLCSIGYSMLDDFGAGDLLHPESMVNDLLAKRTRIFNDLKLPDFARVLNLQPFEKLGSMKDIADGITKLEDAAKVIGPEMLNDVKNQLGVNIPSIDSISIPGIKIPDLPIPAMPAFQIPSAPKRTPLEKVKQKIWTGISLGKRDTLGLEGRAALTVAGTESTQTLRAEADANAYVIGNEVSILSGTGDFKVGPGGVDGRLELYFLGQKAFEPKNMHAEVKFVKEEPKVLSWNFDQGFRQQFMVGPIPVGVKLGVFARLGLGYRVGLVNTQIEAAVIPKAEAGGYAEASIGISGFLSAGAGAEITVISLDAPLTGFAQLMFDPEGYPFIRVGINSDADLQMLNGRIYAFAEYPVPFWIAKSTLTIWEFKGPRVQHKIMSWGMDIGHFGTKTTGDLVDQTDRAEAALLDNQIQLDNRAEELHKYQERLIALAGTVFNDIANDTNSDAQQKVRGLTESVRTLDTAMDQGIQGFNQRLDQIANEL